MRSRISIATLVALTLLAGSTLVLAAFGISNYRTESQRLNEELSEDQISWVEQLAVSLALPVWNFDREQIDKVIESGMHYREVAAVIVRVNGSEVPHVRVRDAQWRVQELHRIPELHGLWTQTRAIGVNGDELGSVTVLVTPAFMQELLGKTFRRTLFMIMLFDLLLVCGMYMLLWRLVLQPVKTLQAQAAAIGKDAELHGTLEGLKFRGELDSLRASLQHTVTLLQDRYDRLLLAEQRFELAVASGNVGIWDWDLSSDLVFYSPQFRQLLGYDSVAEFPPSSETFWNHLHAEDRVKVKEALQAHFAGREPYDLDYRLCTRSGEYRWFTVRGQAYRDGNGKVVRMAGSLMDIHEQRQMQASLREAQDRELHARGQFAQDLLTAQEQERKRIANELHDSVGQNLSLIAGRTQLALMTPGLPAPAVGHLTSTTEIVTATIAEIRTLAQNLRPIHIEQFGLTESVDALLNQVAESRSLLITRTLDNVDDLFAGPNATHLYRIVQEALNNILKHADATHARVALERDVRHVRLIIADDGCGFDVAFGTVRGHSLGLASIQERAHILGGELHIDSSPGEGTTLQVEMPLFDPTATDVPVQRPLIEPA